MDTDHPIPRPGCKRRHSVLEGEASDVESQRKNHTGPGIRSKRSSSKEREEVDPDDFVFNCETWEKWFNAKQREDEPVSQFTGYIQKLLVALRRSGEPNTMQQFHRLRSGLRHSIREILDAQIIQPITYDELVNVALRIEEKERDLQSHMRWKPPAPSPTVKLPPPPKGPKQNRQNSFSKGSNGSYFHGQRSTPNQNPNPHRGNNGSGSKRARKMNGLNHGNAAIPAAGSNGGHHSETTSVSESAGRAAVCFTCGGANHKASDCPKRPAQHFTSH